MIFENLRKKNDYLEKDGEFHHAETENEKKEGKKEK